MTHVIAVDVGTSAIKAAAITQMGEVICAASEEVHSQSVAEGFVEQSPTEWWEQTCKCISALRSTLSNDLVAIVLTGQMQDVILVHGRTEVRGSILYSDTRAGKQVETLRQLRPREQPESFWASSSSIPAKLLWLQEHEPKNMSEADTILFAAHDFVALKLCDVAACDFTTASTTGLCSTGGDGWSHELLALLGLSTRQLPALCPGSVQAGTVSQCVADDLGLPAGVPVFHGCGDAAATTIGSGCSSIGGGHGMYAYIGTSGWVAKATADSVCCPGSVTIRSPEVDDGFISIAPCSNAGGNVESVLVNVFHKHLDRPQAFLAIEQLAACSPPGAGGLLFLPYLNGERCPFTDPNARACYIGMHSKTTQADMHRAVTISALNPAANFNLQAAYRALDSMALNMNTELVVLEGIAFALCGLLEAVEGRNLKTCDGPAACLRVVGGATKSAVLMQAVADVTGYRVVVLGQGEMAAVRGAAILAGLGLGWFERSEALPAGFFPVDREYQPDLGRRRVYSEMMQVFRSLHPALQSAFAKLATVRESIFSD